MIVTLTEVKQFLRIEDDFTDEDTQLQLFIGMAEEYLKNATGYTFDNTNNLAKLAVFVLVSDWYENRNMVGNPSEKVRYTIQSIITQLSYCYIPEEVL